MGVGTVGVHGHDLRVRREREPHQLDQIRQPFHLEYDRPHHPVPVRRQQPAGGDDLSRRYQHADDLRRPGARGGHAGPEEPKHQHLLRRDGPCRDYRVPRRADERLRIRREREPHRRTSEYGKDETLHLTQTQYDSLNHPATVIYPDGSQDDLGL